MKKAVCIILALLFVLIPLSGVTAESGDNTYKTLMYNDRNSETVNFEVEFTFNEAWLDLPSKDYNHSLSKALAVLSGAAYVDVKPDNLVSTLTDMGFDQTSMIAEYPTPTVDDNDTVGYVIAKKTLGEKDIVAVITKGTSEDAEWYSNFNIGTQSNTHEGFLIASEDVWESLEGFLKNISGNVSFMITGHSRGAAVANIIASKLVDSGYDNVYAYTFASPLVSTQACEEGYESIFNILSSEDFVTRLPVAQWGYKRYGKDLFIPSKSFYDPKEYGIMFGKVSEMYFSYTNKLYIPFEGSRDSDDLSRYLFTKSAKKDDFYYEKLYKSGTDKATLDEYFNLMASTLTGNMDSDQSMELLDFGMEFAPISIFFIYNHLMEDKIFSAHSMSSYFSWLSVCEEDDLMENEDFIRISVNGNADIEVYDKDNSLVAGITAGEITKNDIAASNLSGIMYFDIPTKGYTMKIISTEPTEVNISAEKLITSKTDIPVWAKDYYGVEITPEDAVEIVFTESITLTKNNTEVSPVNDLQGDIPLCTILTESVGNGVSYGGGMFRKGSFVTLTAESSAQESFIGWYDGDILLSKDEIYTFAAENDTVIFAQFTRTTGLKGDLNYDGKVNSDDLSLLLSNYLTEETSCDIDSDGQVTSKDLSALLYDFGKTIE